MKKTILSLITLAAIAVNLQAQDTLYLNGLKEGYFCNEWLDWAPEIAWTHTGVGTDHQAVVGGFETKEELTVYGIAAILFTPHFYASEDMLEEQALLIHDTNVGHVEENLRLYRYAGGNMVMHPEELPVNMRRTPISYFMRFDSLTVYRFYDMNSDIALPVYERYFETPVTVTDTFYVGVSNMGYRDYVTGDSVNGQKTRWPIYDVYFFGFPYDFSHTYLSAYQNVNSAWTHQDAFVQYFFYPILTPGENLIDTTIVDTTIVDTTVVDTTIVDTGDTVAIRMPEYYGRYVSVSPNPATGSAEVLSSFGLSRVEVFNAAGRKVMDLKAEGLKATLDVSKLPSGAYLLRIHTPQGMTTKKLVVR